MRLSIVIPTLDEESCLARSLESALRHSDDVWVSDGGSRDRTVELAQDLGVSVVTGEAGRGGQLNRGASQAQGDLLLFLHADTVLPDNAGEQIRQAVSRGAIGGGFHVHYENGGTMLSGLGNCLVRWRTRLSRWPLGDQAQFVRRESFEAMGGFPDWPILEDLHWIRRLHRLGRVDILAGPVRSSARRFSHGGLAKTVATNWMIWGLYFLGVSPRRLAKLYRHVR